MLSGINERGIPNPSELEISSSFVTKIMCSSRTLLPQNTSPGLERQWIDYPATCLLCQMTDRATRAE